MKNTSTPNNIHYKSRSLAASKLSQSTIFKVKSQNLQEFNIAQMNGAM